MWLTFLGSFILFSMRWNEVLVIGLTTLNSVVHTALAQDGLNMLPPCAVSPEFLLHFYESISLTVLGKMLPECCHCPDDMRTY